MKKHIIGIGCSWTQGEGGYPDEIWKEYGGRVQIRHGPDDHLRKYEHENSWVNVLCRDHFPEYIPINAGARGLGNRAAVHQLHFCDKVDFNNSEGIIVLMMSGLDRFDFFCEQPKVWPGEIVPNDGYSDLKYKHYKWRTMHPVPDHGGREKALWEAYAKLLWSEQFVASEAMMALLDLQTFAKAYNYKIAVANAFNINLVGLLKEHSGYLFDKFDWSTNVHNTTEYESFMEKLVDLDNKMPKSKNAWHGYYSFYRQLNWPSEYLTNCDGAHPTIKGYKAIADELAKFIKYKNYA